MTTPRPGEVYERDGLRREVLKVLYGVRWRRPGVGAVRNCRMKAWQAWAAKAQRVEERA